MAFIQETADKIRKEVIDYISSNGLRFEEWYLGVSDEPVGWVGEYHKVNMNPAANSKWNCWNAESKENAIAAHQSIKKEFNTQGDIISGIDSSFTYIYAYLITPTTKE